MWKPDHTTPGALEEASAIVVAEEQKHQGDGHGDGKNAVTISNITALIDMEQKSVLTELEHTQDGDANHSNGGFIVNIKSNKTAINLYDVDKNIDESLKLSISDI